MTDTIYRCRRHETNAAGEPHVHSRWDGSRSFTNHARAGSTPPPECTRQVDPRGAQLLFSSNHYTVDIEPPMDRQPTWDDLAQTCDIPRHANAPDPHWHMQPLRGEVHWHNDPTSPSTTLYTALPGAFHPYRAPTERESPTMTDTFTPGDIVLASQGRPFGAGPEHLYVIVRKDDNGRNPLYTTLASTGGAIGWGPAGRDEISDAMQEFARGCGFWNVRESYLRLATEVEAEALPRDMEEMRRRIQIEMLGEEPVLLCTDDTHMEGDHRHARNDFGRLMGRNPARPSNHRPVPGLWNRNQSSITVSRIRDTQTTTTPTEQVEMHPLNRDKMRDHPTFTLHSIAGERHGNDIVFGCQRFPMSVIAAGQGTVTFGPDRRATVTMEARADTAGVWVGDRELAISDVNAYTRSIIATSTLTEPPAPVLNAVVMEHGYYGCAAHPNEVLHLFRGDDGNVYLGKVHPERTGHALTGIVGLRSGLAERSHFRDCQPVRSSTTAQIMHNETGRNYSLVPITETQREYFVGARYTFGTLPEDGRRIVSCDVSGMVRTDG